MMFSRKAIFGSTGAAGDTVIKGIGGVTVGLVFGGCVPQQTKRIENKI